MDNIAAMDSMAEQLSLFQLPRTGQGHADQAYRGSSAGSGVLQLGNEIIRYELRRGARRRLSLTISEHGLRIAAPLTLPLATIEAFARENAEWIQRKLHEQALAPRPRRLLITDDCRLPLLGRDIPVRVLPGHNRHRWVGDTLVLEARPGATLNVLAQRALQKRAFAHFAERLTHYAPHMAVQVPPLALSSARTRWGSCSRLSGIRINWRLIHLPAHLGDYVVVHELAHLHHMNHSKQFWGVVAATYPDWQGARHELNAAAKTLVLI